MVGDLRYCIVLLFIMCTLSGINILSTDKFSPTVLDVHFRKIFRIAPKLFILAILSQTENPDQDGNAWYLPRSERAISSESEIFVDGFLIFISMLIILQVLIPVSLYVTLEIVKLGQVRWISVRQFSEIYRDSRNSPSAK